MPSMIVIKNLFPTLKKVMYTATAVLALMQCSEEEAIVPVAAATSTSSADQNISASSLTVTGSNTSYATLTDCSTCSYIVSEKESVIDGKELGFKAGDIICINKGVKYGDLEFVNIEGTASNPIVIATVKSQIKPIAKLAAGQDPY
jgi:hypothetical protein